MLVSAEKIGVHVVKGLLPETFAARVFFLPGNRKGDFGQEIHDVDAQSPACLRSARLMLKEIESPVATGVYDDKIGLSASLGSPLLPLPTFLNLGAQNQAAKPGCKVAVGKVRGWAAGLSTAGCSKNANACEGIGKPKGVSIAPIP